MHRTKHCNSLMRGTSLMPLAIGVSALLGCSEGSIAPPSAPSFTPSASGDGRESSRSSRAAVATLAWEKTARDLVTRRGVGPLPSVRLYALHSLAQYAAVVAVSRDDDSDRGGGRAGYEARRGAIAGASAAILSHLFPVDATLFQNQVTAEGNASPGGTQPEFTRGRLVGEAAAAVMIAWANADGFSATWSEDMRNPPGPGKWAGIPGVAPAGFQFPTMKPYFLKSLGRNRSAQSQFRSGKPPKYTTDRPKSEFEKGLAEMKRIFSNRGAQGEALATFWNVVGIGHWGQQADLFIAERQLGEREASRIFALMYGAVMDATIGCWEAKFHYFFLRPNMADPSIHPFLVQPNHPSYPSGHSCIAGAAVTVLSSYFPAQARNLGAQMEEAGLSRIYGGIHYPFDITAGQELGRATAKWAMAYDRKRGLLTAVDLDSDDGEREHD